MSAHVTVDEVMKLARGLSPLEKLRLIERLAPDLEAAMATQPRQGLRGLFKACSISDEDIRAVRREMWQTFPREDV